MSTPWRFAAWMIVSKPSATTSLPFSLNGTGIALISSDVIAVIAFLVLPDLVGKIFHHAAYRIRRGLSQAADRRVRHRRGELFEQRAVPAGLRHQPERFRGTDA